MKILAIEVSANVASVAVGFDDKIIGEFSLLSKNNHSVTLMPMIENMLSLLNIDISEIDYLACAKGPGSFTGLRIGASVVKGISQGINKKIIPVPTLDALAYNVFSENKIIVSAMDARRSQIYTAFYKWENQKLVKLTEEMALPLTEAFSMLKQMGYAAIFTGNGALAFSEEIKEAGFSIAPIHNINERAANVCAISFDLLKNGFEALDFKDFVPDYLRLSQAEREKQNDNN